MQVETMRIPSLSALSAARLSDDLVEGFRFLDGKHQVYALVWRAPGSDRTNRSVATRDPARFAHLAAKAARAALPGVLMRNEHLRYVGVATLGEYSLNNGIVDIPSLEAYIENAFLVAFQYQRYKFELHLAPAGCHCTDGSHSPIYKRPLAAPIIFAGLTLWGMPRQTMPASAYRPLRDAITPENSEAVAGFMHQHLQTIPTRVLFLSFNLGGGADAIYGSVFQSVEEAALTVLEWVRSYLLAKRPCMPGTVPMANLWTPDGARALTPAVPITEMRALFATHSEKFQGEGAEVMVTYSDGSPEALGRPVWGKVMAWWKELQ